MASNYTSKFLVLLFIGLFSLAPTASTTNHTLEWGVEVGEEFTYALQRIVFDPNYVQLMPYWLGFLLDLEAGDLFTATVMELDVMPENITDSQDIPVSHVTLAKDTNTLELDSTAFIIPIGDWNLLTDSLNLTAHPDITLIDSDAEWGTSESSTFTVGYSTYTYSFEWIYEKTNGTLSYTKFLLTTSGSTLIDIVVSLWTEGVPTIIPDDLQLTTILIIAIAGSVGIVVAILVYRTIKTPRGLAAELGR